MKTKLCLATFGTVIPLLFLVHVTVGQEEMGRESTSAPRLQHQNQFLPSSNAALPVNPHNYANVSGRRRSNNSPSTKIKQGVAQLRSANTAEELSAVKAKLTQALDEYFEADLVRREQEIAKVEQRIQKLKAQVEKRRASKQQIIDFQLQVLQNEAEGLGFYSGRKPSGFGELDWGGYGEYESYRSWSEQPVPRANTQPRDTDSTPQGLPEVK